MLSLLFKEGCLQFHTDSKFAYVCPTCGMGDVQQNPYSHQTLLNIVWCDVLAGGVDAPSQCCQCLWKWSDVNIALDEPQRRKSHTVRSSDPDSHVQKMSEAAARLVHRPGRRSYRYSQTFKWQCSNVVVPRRFGKRTLALPHPRVVALFNSPARLGTPFLWHCPSRKRMNQTQVFWNMHKTCSLWDCHVPSRSNPDIVAFPDKRKVISSLKNHPFRESLIQHRERYTRYSSEGLMRMGVALGHLQCHRWGSHRMRLRSAWNCKYSSFSQR